MAVSEIRTAVLDTAQTPAVPVATTVRIEVADGGDGAQTGVTVQGITMTRAELFMENVRDAIRESQFDYPRALMTLSIEPALPESAQHDLAFPVAMGILDASGQLPDDVAREVKRSFVIGSLNRDGDVGEWYARRQVEAVAADAGMPLIASRQVPSLDDIAFERHLIAPPESTLETPSSPATDPIQPGQAEEVGRRAEGAVSQDIAEAVVPERETLLAAMEKAGYGFDQVNSSEGYLSFVDEYSKSMYFESWVEVEEWLNGVVFDDAEVSEAVERVLHPERFEETREGAEPGAPKPEADSAEAHSRESRWTSHESEIEGSYDVNDMRKLYVETVDKAEYPDGVPAGAEGPSEPPAAEREGRDAHAGHDGREDQVAGTSEPSEAELQVARLEVKLAAAEAKSGALEEKLGALGADLSSMRERAWGAEAERDDLKTQVEFLSSQLTSEREARADAKGALEEAEARISELEAAGAQASADAAEPGIQEKYEYLQKENADLVNWVDELEGKLAESRAEEMRSEALLAERNKEIESLKEALSAATSDASGKPEAVPDDFTLGDFRYVAAIGADEIAKQYELDLPDGTMMAIYPAQLGPDAEGKWDWEMLRGGMRLMGRADTAEQAAEILALRNKEKMGGGRLSMPSKGASQRDVRSVGEDARAATASAHAQMRPGANKSKSLGGVMRS